MPQNDINTINAEIHLELAKKLLEKVRSGEATAADLNVARQYLKDNGIDGTPRQNPHMLDLAHEVPFPRAASSA